MRKRVFFAVLACLLCMSFAAAGVTVFAQKEYAMNFAGVTSEEEDGYVYHNYYINENDWLIGSEIVRPSYSDTKEQEYIFFSDTTETSVFGPRAKFSDFICRFNIDMEDLAGVTGAAIGLSFNRSQLFTRPSAADGVFFMDTEDGTVVRATGGSMDVATVGRFWLQYEEEGAVDLWKGDVSLDVMVVKHGDTARVYFAPEGDAEGLRVCRAVISGVSGSGYVAVAGYAGASFYLDSMVVTPLSYAEEQAASVQGAAAKSGDVYAAGHGGAVLSEKSFTDTYLAADIRVTAGSSFLLRFGNTFVNFAADGTVSGKGLLLVSGGKVDFSAFAAGAAVRLFAVGKEVFVEADTGSGFAQVARFTALTPLQAGTAGVEAGADASLIVSGFGVLDLAGTIEIEAHDYDPETDIAPVHEKELSFNEYYGLTEEE